MIDFPRIAILGVLIVLVSIFLYPIGENLVYLSIATFIISITITFFAFREMIGLVLLIFIISLVVVTFFFSNIFFGILVGSIVVIAFVLLDIFIY